ncbi:hypothetical protein AB4Z52_32335 [Rhizobium sp. 2YAF20]|uniref:hypothetical protein n=1 Tax=Rhizobium sp. 2YAF20 TaxID=3233027 RepID=UPI003F9ADE70
MAKIQFDDIGSDDNEMLVYGLFSTGEEIISFGDRGLAEILTRIQEDNHFEVKAIYEDVKASGLTDFKISFEIEEDGNTSGVFDLKAVVDGHEFHLGCYFVFAEGNGVHGLLSGVRIRERWAEDA